MILVVALQFNVDRVWQYVLVLPLELYQVEWEIDKHYLSYQEADLQEKDRYHKFYESQEVEHGECRQKENDQSNYQYSKVKL